MKKRIFKKKVFKGMTLVEIIIAIAVLAVMTSVLVAASSSIQGYLRAAGDMNDRVAAQAPVAQAENRAAAVEIASDLSIIITPDDDAPNSTIALNGKVYGVYDNDEMLAHENEAGGGLNMKFIVDVATMPTVADDTTPSTGEDAPADDEGAGGEDADGEEAGGEEAGGEDADGDDETE